MRKKKALSKRKKAETGEGTQPRVALRNRPRRFSSEPPPPPVAEKKEGGLARGGAPPAEGKTQSLASLHLRGRIPFEPGEERRGSARVKNFCEKALSLFPKRLAPGKKPARKEKLLRLGA